MIRLLDRELLRNEFLSARPYPFVKIENFLQLEAAEEIAASYPSFDEALGKGKTFATVNERKKVQITDWQLFPPPVAALNQAIASPAFLADLSFITGLRNLRADPNLVGGGMHITGPGGRLDVHIDFDYMKDRDLHRRINLLLYLNPVWNEQWGGDIQLWDREVKSCEASFSPVFNRCIIFETSNISYHGVTPVSSSAQMPRQSFAAYYYTKEAPAYWDGIGHSTIFKARPEERVRRLVLMPAETIKGNISRGVRTLKDSIKALTRR